MLRKKRPVNRKKTISAIFNSASFPIFEIISTVKKQFLFLVIWLFPACISGQDSLDLGRTADYLKKYLPYNRKMVILDFYNMRCRSCITAFPKFEELQRKYADDIEIVLVCDDRKIDSQWIRKHLANISMKKIFNDTVMGQLFKHATVSHIVWLDASFKIKGFTGKHEVNSDNIELFLKNELDTLVTKRDMINYNAESILTQVRYRSTLSGRQTLFNRNSGIYTNEFTNSMKIFVINEPAYVLVDMAYKLHKRKPAINIPHDSVFCYELVMPIVSERKALRFMQADLERYLGIRRPGLFRHRH